MDRLISVTTHEIAETVSDPAINAYKVVGDTANQSGEIADVCHGQYLDYKVTNNSQPYNLVFKNGKKWIIDTVFSPVRSTCAITKAEKKSPKK